MDSAAGVERAPDSVKQILKDDKAGIAESSFLREQKKTTAVAAVFLVKV